MMFGFTVLKCGMSANIRVDVRWVANNVLIEHPNFAYESYIS